MEGENLGFYGRRQQIQLGFSSAPITAAAALLANCSSPSSSNFFPAIGDAAASRKFPPKRSRTSYHNMQNPCCQVEGCNLDLKLAKDYHRRHRICEPHSKSPKVVVAGKERRFCQQCSRFHDLSEFDDTKRSCRRRLSDHNARRRRVQPEFSSPTLYDQRQHNLLLNGLPVSLPNSKNLIRPYIHSSNPQILDQCVHLGSTNSSMISAHSLLSSNTWSMSEGKSTPKLMEQRNYSQVLRNPEAELFHGNSIGVDEGPLISVHEAGPSHHQEYQLFKDSCDSATFYSHQRTL